MDIETIEALAMAINKFEGGVVLVRQSACLRGAGSLCVVCVSSVCRLPSHALFRICVVCARLPSAPLESGRRRARVNATCARAAGLRAALQTTAGGPAAPPLACLPLARFTKAAASYTSRPDSNKTA